MRITILNGSTETSKLDTTLEEVNQILENSGHQIIQLDLRKMDLRYCVGCFGCWVKTPGVCISQDASREIDHTVINSDFTLWAAPLRMGFPSALLKMALDKSIPLVHPYFEVDRGEAHHRPRYNQYPRLGLLLEAEGDTDSTDIEIVSDILRRTAINFKSELEFSLTTETSVNEIADHIIHPKKSLEGDEQLPKAIPGVRIDPPEKLTIFNGSPRGRKGNTPIMLKQFGNGFASISEHRYEIHDLNRIRELDENRERYANAECAWLGFPLYTDAMPGMVKAFIETLSPLKGRRNNPPIGFLVQSGFPEASHSRYLERYLKKLAARLDAPYLGTIVKGGGEATRMLPEKATQKFFNKLQALGAYFAQNGSLDADVLKAIAGVEHYPSYLAPIFRIFLRTPLASWYWDSMLKDNRAYEERFAKPYVTENL